MRKIGKAFIFIFLLLIIPFSLAACNGDRQNVSGTMTLVVGTGSQSTYTVKLDEVEITRGLISILEHLKEAEGLQFTMQESSLGAYLTAVGELSQNTEAGEYIYVYTTVESDFDVSAHAVTVDYGGKTLTSSGVGADKMTLEDNCIIYIGLKSF